MPDQAEHRKTNVLFVCQYGSVKSAYARERFLRLAAERGLNVSVRSCAITPEDHLPPDLEVEFERAGVDAKRQPLARLAQLDISSADVVVVFNSLPPQLVCRNVIDWTDTPSMIEHYDAARAVMAPRLEALALMLDKVQDD